MPDPSTYRPATGTIPLEPGVYRFRDERGRVIYVGKAKSLRQRLNSYFSDLSALHPRTRQMVTTAAGVEWTTVSTEVEALQLEYNWIKEFDPRFNVRYRDDKSYPSLAVTLYEEFPRLQVMRGPKKKGVRYFGPYAHAWAIRETLDLLLRVFPARTCSAGVFKRAGQVGRPCLLGYIGKCSAPCVGRVTAEEHRAIVDDFCDFMTGQTDGLIRRLDRQMAAASAGLEFERAARLRDDVGALRRAMEKQAVVFGDGTDADVVAFAQDELEASVQVFHVRGGRVRGQRGWTVDKVEAVSTGGLVEQFVTQFYGDAADADGEGNAIPREILVPELPEDVDVLTEWLSARRGSRVAMRIPQRGDKRALMETVARNAGQDFLQHKLKRASDLTARSLALAELQEALELREAPLRIECFDISHIQGTDVVASMVVFEDGLARKSEYRRFAMREDGGDTDWIAEAVRRRFSRYLDAQPAEPGPGLSDVSSVSRRFAYPPNLVVVDGAGPQANAAQAVLDGFGIEDVAVVGLAKRLEEVWKPGEPYPVILPRTAEALYLLQRVRDEAHRFAITYHRQKRSKSMVESALDDVPGLGATRRKALLAHFGSLARLRRAALADVMAVPGIGVQTAQAILAAVAGPAGAPEPAVNTATGELVDQDTIASGELVDQDTITSGELVDPDTFPSAGMDAGTIASGEHGLTAPRAGLDDSDEEDGGAQDGRVERGALDTIVVSGLSGAGRSTAAKCLEDLGYFVVDNLPPELIATMVELGSRSQGAVTKIAVVMDVRSRAFSSDLRAVIDDLAARGLAPRLLFLEATDEVLVRRFESVRREHPLQGAGRLIDGIRAERGLLVPLRESADLVLDTSTRSVHELRRMIEQTFVGESSDRPRLRATVVSFGFKYGLPVDADMVADVRFLPNPFWIPELREQNGRDDEVRDYVLAQTGAVPFLDLYTELLATVGAGYRREGKHYLTLAVGCTGGKHRSVAISEELAARLRAMEVTTTVVHRDLGRE